jgi:hypothetical protein
VKTPIPFIGLFLIGVAILTQRARQALGVLNTAGGALAVLGVSLLANINLGVRHILPTYPHMAIGRGELEPLRCGDRNFLV